MNMWKHVRENESLCETLGEYLGWWEFIYVYLDYLILFESNDELLSICLHNYDYVRVCLRIWVYFMIYKSMRECLRVWMSISAQFEFCEYVRAKKIREIISE